MPIDARQEKEKAVARIVADYRGQIEDGRLTAGMRLPGVNTLAGDYGTGIYQARKAVSILKDEGLVESRPKSGVYVREGVAPASGSNGIYRSGRFHLFDNPAGARSPVRLLMHASTPEYSRAWDNVRARFSTAGVGLELIFPDEKEDFWRLVPEADIILANPAHIFLDDRLSQLAEPLPKKIVSGAGLAEKYLESVASDGQIMGMPLTGTAFLGLLNPDFISPSERETLGRAGSWPEAWQILFDIQKQGKADYICNMGAVGGALDLAAYIMLAGEGIVDVDDGRPMLSSEKNRAAIGQLAEFLPRLRLAPVGMSPMQALERSILTFGYTYQFNRLGDAGRYYLWPYPVAAGQTPPEGVVVAVLNKNANMVNEARQLVELFSTRPVQSQLSDIRGEYPLCLPVDEAFAAHPEKWRAGLSRLRRESRPFYSSTMGLVQYPDVEWGLLAAAFWGGNINADEFIASGEKVLLRLVNERPCFLGKNKECMQKGAVT